MQPQTLNQLIAALQSGNENASAEIYTQLYDKIYYRCLTLLKDKATAKDATQDIFLKVFAKISTFQPNTDFGAWVYRITYNHCLNVIKKNGRFRLEELKESAKLTDDQHEQTAKRKLAEMNLRHLHAALSHLSPPDRMLMLARYRDGLPIVQVAALLELGESAVKMRLSRLRTKLNLKIKTHAKEE